MTDFIMLQVNKIFKEYEEKETLTKEDIDKLNKYLDSFEKQAESYHIELTEENKESIKARFQNILAKISAPIEVEAVAPTSDVDDIDTVEYDDSEFDDDEMFESDSIGLRIFEKIKSIKAPKLFRKSNTPAASFGETLRFIFKGKENKENVNTVEEIETTDMQEETPVTPVNVTINPEAKEKLSNGFKLNKKQSKVVAVGVVVAVTAIAVAACAANENSKAQSMQIPASSIEAVVENADIVPNKVEEIAKAKKDNEKEKLLPENLAFDVNDNDTLVNNMTDFIVDSIKKGIAVKDVMTEQEIAQAENNDISFVTIEQLMDYYFVMNIEDIDPVDYARLSYKTKTTDTVINNYLACANIFMDDLLTVKQDTVIDYTRIIGDKESANGVQTFANMIGDFNSKNIQKSEISSYIEENYITKYDDRYSVSANEQTYRFMFSFDELTNGQGIPNDINIILNEDKTYSCSTTRSEGERNKSERSQDYTDIKNIIDDKLAISRDNYDQDTTNIAESELKTGVELEKEIKENVIELNVSFVENPKFVVEAVHTTSTKSSTTTSTAKASTVKGDNGKAIAQSELDKFGIDSTSPTAKSDYEAAVKNEFEQQAQSSSTHTITDTDGNVMVSGSEVDTSSYNQGFSDGYYAGNNLKSYSPKNSGASYKAGYGEGYSLGKSDRATLDASISNQTTTTYEDVDDKVVSSETSNETYTDYTYDAHINDNTSNNTTTSGSIETVTEFVPVEDTSSETIVEETYEDYTPDTQSVETVETYDVSLESNQAQNEVEIHTLTRNDELISEYSNLKDILTSIKDTLDDTLEDEKML